MLIVPTNPFDLLEQIRATIKDNSTADLVLSIVRPALEETHDLRVKNTQLELGIKNLQLQSELDLLRVNSELERQIAENKQMKSRRIDRNFREIIKLGETYKDHKYGPHAIKGLSEALLAPESVRRGQPVSSVMQEAEDLSERIALAKSQGFRWDQRNREPSKVSTKMKKISLWEETYQEVFDNASLEELRDEDYPGTYPEGIPREAAQAAVIARLQEEIGEEIEFKPNVSKVNKHKRLTKELQKSNGIGDFVDEFFSHCPADQRESLTQTISERGLTVRVIKRIMSKGLLPRTGGSLVWSEHDHMDDQKLSSMYHGEYDDQIRNLIKKFLGEDAETG